MGDTPTDLDVAEGRGFMKAYREGVATIRALQVRRADLLSRVMDLSGLIAGANRERNVAQSERDQWRRLYVLRVTGQEVIDLGPYTLAAAWQLEHERQVAARRLTARARLRAWVASARLCLGRFVAGPAWGDEEDEYNKET